MEGTIETKSAKAEAVTLFETSSPAELEIKMGPMKSKLFGNVLTARARPKIASTLKDMASLFVQSVYTVSQQYRYIPSFCRLEYRPDGLGV